MATTRFFGAGDAKISGGSRTRIGVNSQGRTNSIFSFNRNCNCPTITSYCCVDDQERINMIKSIFNPGLQPFALAKQFGMSWTPAYAL